MNAFSIYGVIAINLFILVRYVWLIYQRRIKPALAMWLFFTIAVGGNLATYLSEGDYGLLDNILGTADILLVSLVTLAILLFGDKSTKFNRFDLGCLAAVIVIVAFWLITQHHIVSNVCIQAILIIAYFPVVKRLWKTEENTESFAAWIGLLLAPIISLLSSKGILATLYALRAILSTSFLLTLMVRVEWRTKRKRLA